MKSAKFFFASIMLILLAMASTVFGEEPPSDYPSYQNGIITIPRMDIFEQLGIVQDIKLNLTEQGDWRLTEFKAVGTSVGTQTVLTRPFVETVEIIITDTFPVQVFLKVSGLFTYGCIKMGKIPQQLKDNRFEVVMYAEVPNPNEFTCTANITPFEEIIPLTVYGLSAGTYEYRLSGVSSFDSTAESLLPKTYTGTFVLTKDNKF